jgi:glycosyltransferase involved in cell wall biosynthesis
MNRRTVFLFSDVWKQTGGVSSLYRAVFRSLLRRSDLDSRLSLVWIYPSERLSIEEMGPVTLVGVRPTFYTRVPMFPDLTTGILTPRQISILSDRFGFPDIVHAVTQGPFGAAGHLFARAKRISCTSFCHTNWPAYFEAYLGAAYAGLGSRYERWFFSRCETLFCHTRASAARLEWHSSPPLIVVLSQFLDTVRFPICHRNEPPKTNAKLSLVYAGRLAREKSVHTLLQYSDHPGVVVHVAGDGPLRSRLQRKYAAAIFHGYLDGAALRNVIRQSDYLVLPSLTETLGLVVLEAAAWGTPSVSIRGAVPSEVVERYDAGIFFDSLDEPDWLEVARDTRSSEHYHALVRGCRSMATSHAADIGAERMLSFWRDH